VPSVHQGSQPDAAVIAVKQTRPANAVSSLGKLLSAGFRSASRTVPAVVPSLVHSSRPCVPSSAPKTSRPPRSIISNTKECAGPGWMSFTSAVPASVPSVLHSSSPVSGVRATKNRRPPLATHGASPSVVQGRSVTRTVPAVVPSVRQICRPWPPLSAGKNTAPAKSAKRPGWLDDPPGKTSRRSVVPASVPSEVHGSIPSNVRAEKKRRPPAIAGSFGSDGSAFTTVPLMSRTRCAGEPARATVAASRHATAAGPTMRPLSGLTGVPPQRGTGVSGVSKAKPAAGSAVTSLPESPP
jgi:hypothetical protein